MNTRRDACPTSPPALADFVAVLNEAYRMVFVVNIGKSVTANTTELGVRIQNVLMRFTTPSHGDDCATRISRTIRSVKHVKQKDGSSQQRSSTTSDRSGRVVDRSTGTTFNRNATRVTPGSQRWKGAD